MKTVEVTIDKSRETGLSGKAVTLDHVERHRLVSPETLIIDAATGRELIVFGKLSGDHGRLKKFLPGIRYITGHVRLSRYQNNSENTKSADVQFGYRPKRPVFNLPAAACTLNTERPEVYRELTAYGQMMMDLYRQHSPKTFERQTQLMAGVKDWWRIPGTFFTQGIINDTANLDFHYDRGNITGCWSAMAVFMRHVSGGQLVVPALGIALAVEDSTYVMFDGQGLLHGVAPIKRESQYARRFSIVYYAHALMRNCGTYEEELEKMRQVDMRKHLKATRK
jgi:hypothetical protein